MKIIDLLNKIANGEEVPNKIYYEGNVYKALPDTTHTDTYYDDSTGRELYYHLNELNDEIIILETTITYKQDDYISYQPYTGEFNLKPQEPTPYEPYTPPQDDKIEKLDYIHPDISCSYNESELLLRIEANKNKINEIIDKLKGKCQK